MIFLLFILISNKKSRIENIVEGTESFQKQSKTKATSENNMMKLAEALADYLLDSSSIPDYLGSNRIPEYTEDTSSIYNALEIKDYTYFTSSKIVKDGEVIYSCRICHDDIIDKGMLENHLDVHFYRTDCSICRIRLFRFQVEKHKDLKVAY